MKSKEKLGKRLKRTFQMEDMIIERDQLEMRGMGEVTVRECGRILLYSKTEITLSLRECILKILGEELYCSSYYGGIVRVEGKIQSLNFIERGGKK